MFVYFTIASDYSRVSTHGFIIKEREHVNVEHCIAIVDDPALWRCGAQAAYSVHSIGKIVLLASLGLLMDEWCSVLYMNEHLYPRPWHLSRTFLCCCVAAVNWNVFTNLGV